MDISHVLTFPFNKHSIHTLKKSSSASGACASKRVKNRPIFGRYKSDQPPNKRQRLNSWVS